MCLCYDSGMRIGKTDYIAVSTLLVLTLFSAAALTLPGVKAEGTVDIIEITVPVACSMTGTVSVAHTESILNGHVEENIGTTNIKVVCNDNSGYAVYAIGYTDDEYGKTVLTDATLDSSNDIVTGLATTGNTSNWAMKLTKAGSTYLPIIAGSIEDSTRQTGDPDFSAYAVVPSEYTKVLYYPSSTDLGTGASGSNFTTTYRAYVSLTQPAGTYVGQVKYVLVHPNTSAVPEICNPTGTTVGTNTSTDIICMQDMSSANKSTILASMSTGTRYTLVDIRDKKNYAVAKLADGNLWMLDNLALDIVATDLNTLKGNTNASDTTLEYLKGTHVRGDGNITGDTNYPTASVGYFDTNDYYSIPKIAISGDCNDANCVNDPETGKWTSDSTTTGGNAQGKIGIYYNYCAASAGSYCYGSGTNITGSPSSDPNTSSLTDVTEDICPSGWRLPTSSDAAGEFQSLYTQYSSSYLTFQTALSTPLSGRFNFGKAYSQGNAGYFWSSTWLSTNSMRNLYVGSSVVNPSSNGNRYFGFSVRCILGP